MALLCQKLNCLLVFNTKSKLLYYLAPGTTGIATVKCSIEVDSNDKA